MMSQQIKQHYGIDYKNNYQWVMNINIKILSKFSIIHVKQQINVCLIHWLKMKFISSLSRWMFVVSIDTWINNIFTNSINVELFILINRIRFSTCIFHMRKTSSIRIFLSSFFQFNARQKINTRLFLSSVIVKLFIICFRRYYYYQNDIELFPSFDLFFSCSCSYKNKTHTHTYLISISLLFVFFCYIKFKIR